MARKKITRSATAVNLSGQLGNALAYHAGERMRHLFLFLFATDAACRLVNAELGAAFKPGSMIKEAASHQVDSGLRSNDQTRDVFDETDANIIQVPSTSFNKIDAAHYCNLGLVPSNWARLTAAAESLKGDTAVEMIERPRSTLPTRSGCRSASISDRTGSSTNCTTSWRRESSPTASRCCRCCASRTPPMRRG